MAFVNNTLVTAPLADPGVPRAQIDPRFSAYLLDMLKSSERQWREALPLGNARGRYLTSLAAQLAMAAVGDTLLVVTLQTAELTGVTVDSANVTVRWKVSLPEYFRSPAPREEVRSIPWITVHGDKKILTAAPQIAAAAIAPDGTVYALRNYSMRWEDARSPMFRTQGYWKPDLRGIDVYDRHGVYLRSFGLPGQLLTGMAADAHGRLMISSHDSIYVASVESSTNSCPKLPTRVAVRIADDPAEP